MRLLLPLLLLMLTACQKDFDTQYAETEKRLKADAEAIDREMAKEEANKDSESQ